MTMIRQTYSFSVVLAAIAVAVVPAGAALAKTAPKVCAELKVIDPDNDGKLDLAEAKKAAEAAFDKINKDADKTLEGKELKGRLSKKALKAGDPDKDGTLDKAEYVAMVDKLFAAANPDKDGTLECKELKSTAGRAMLKLLK
jgi:Ca2+-binding EF-hand superfamily protein